MSFITWIVLGLVAGFIGSKIVNKAGEGILLDIVLGIVGAVVGGWLFSTFGASGVTGLNLYSLLVAVIGAVIFLFAYHGIRRVVGSVETSRSSAALSTVMESRYRPETPIRSNRRTQDSRTPNVRLRRFSGRLRVP